MSRLTEMAWGSNKLHFTYDSIGPASVTYNGVKYFYLKTDGTMAATLGAANPLRYRGYVYDSETGFYTELPMNGFGFSASSLIGFSFEVCWDDD